VERDSKRCLFLDRFVLVCSQSMGAWVSEILEPDFALGKERVRGCVLDQGPIYTPDCIGLSELRNDCERISGPTWTCASATNHLGLGGLVGGAAARGLSGPGPGGFGRGPRRVQRRDRAH